MGSPTIMKPAPSLTVDRSARSHHQPGGDVLLCGPEAGWIRAMRAARRTLVRLAMALLVTTLCCGALVYFFPNLPLISLARWWSTTVEPPRQADVAIVLGGGKASRPYAAAELWKSGRVDRILVFAQRQPDGSHDGAASLRILIDVLDVSPEAVELISPPVSSTFAEAVVASNLVRERGIGSVVIPTDIFHSRRVSWVFSKYLPRFCEIAVTKAVDHRSEVGTWWKNPQGRAHFLGELAKMASYWVLYR